MNNRTIHNKISPFAIALTVLGISASAKAAPGEVLILDSTVTGGLASPEATRIAELGLTPVLIDALTWAGMSTVDFSDYEAIVLGDPSCGVNASVMSAAQANAETWAAAVDGNVMILGTDPVWHISYGPYVGPQALNDNALGFVLADAGTGTTGAYITLSCYYHSSPAAMVPVLSGFGEFELQGAQVTGALNDVHIVAAHPSLDSLSDEALSNWNNSVHENFLSWPNEFEVLALALDGEGSFVAGDGSLGFPYLLARGVIPDRCGDGNLDPAEECDDGNNDDGDGCDAACNVELREVPPIRPPRECPDRDQDGVCDDDDLCSGTIVPEPVVPTKWLGVNHFALVDDDIFFDTTPPGNGEPIASYTIHDTGGCSCEQIIEALGLGQGHMKFGCNVGIMNEWVTEHAEAPLLGGGVELGDLQSPNALPDPEASDNLQINGCRLVDDEPGNGPAWAFLGLMLAAIGRRRRP